MTLHATHFFFKACTRRTLVTVTGVFGIGMLSAVGLWLLCSTPALAAVSVMPISEDGSTISPAADSSLPPSWQPGRLLSEEEWKRYSNRPHAFDRTVTMAQNHPNGATGYVRDPAYMPVLPMTESKGNAKSRSKKPVTRPAITSPKMPVVASPYGTALSRPGESPYGTTPNPAGAGIPSPTVTSPKTPTVASPKAPTVASPYSATAEPTGPVGSPANPTAPVSPKSAAVANPATPANPSLAAQPEAQDGLMSSGRGIVTDMAQGVASGTSAGTAGDAASASAGTSAGTIGASTTNTGRSILRGPANSLVVPPNGISLTPNNGSGALTAPANPQ